MKEISAAQVHDFQGESGKRRGYRKTAYALIMEKNENLGIKD